jgi:hypothetical protein
VLTLLLLLLLLLPWCRAARQQHGQQLVGFCGWYTQVELRFCTGFPCCIQPTTLQQRRQATHQLPFVVWTASTAPDTHVYVLTHS